MDDALPPRAPHGTPLVVFCLDNGGIGGTELNALKTAVHLVRRGWGVEVVSLSREPELMARYEQVGIPVHVLSMPSIASAAAFTEGLRLRRLLRHRRAHVFHAHDAYGNIFGVPWARLARVPVVLASRRWWTQEIRSGHRSANRIAYRLADAVVANSERVARAAQADAGSRTRVVVIPNFVDEDAFQRFDNNDRWRRLNGFGVPVGRVVVGCVANLRPVKDHASLLTATARVVGAGYDIHLMLVGDGELRAELTRLADGLGIADRVAFVGLHRPSWNLHGLFDISTLTSTDEAFSNSLLEAMAAGKPVVATAVGGTPDAVVDGETGILVPPKDPTSLASALTRLITDPGLASRMGEAGRKRLRTHFSAGLALDALSALYTGLLGEKRRLVGQVGADIGWSRRAVEPGNPR